MRRHPLHARLYARAGPRLEAEGYGALRRRLLAGLTGRVVDVGAGDGMNLAHYPPGVRHVLAVEPEPYLRRRAAARVAAGAAGRAGAPSGEVAVPATVVAGTAERLPLADAGVDAAVVSLVLCTVVDVPAALGELRRVLVPGGELRFLEHVRADAPGLARLQRVLDATVWPALVGGCHTHRDTVAAVESAGFTIRRLEPARVPATGGAGPTTHHVLGVATP